MTQIFKKNWCRWWKMKTSFCCFQNLKTKTQWQYGNFIQLMGPTTLSCHVMPAACTQWLSLSQTLFSFFLFSSSLHFFFYIEPSLLLHKPLPQATTEPLKPQTWIWILTITKNKSESEWLQWSESRPLLTMNFGDSSDSGFKFHQ